jgi:hypothetical protein
VHQGVGGKGIEGGDGVSVERGVESMDDMGEEDGAVVGGSEDSGGRWVGLMDISSGRGGSRRYVLQEAGEETYITGQNQPHKVAVWSRARWTPGCRCQ